MESLQNMESPKNQIAEYNPVKSGLAELKARLKGVAYDLSVTVGFDAAKKDRRELVSLRTSLEAMRKAVKAPYFAKLDELETEATRITAEIVALEKPIDDQIKAEETRREAVKQAKQLAEEARVAVIRGKLTAITMTPVNAAGKSWAYVVQALATLVPLEITHEEFAEFQLEAISAKEAAVSSLSVMRAAVEDQEIEAKRLADERAELARIKADQEREQAAALAALNAQREAQEAEAKKEAMRQAQITEDARKVAEVKADAIAAEQQAIRVQQAEAQAALDRRAKALADEEAAAQLRKDTEAQAARAKEAADLAATKAADDLRKANEVAQKQADDELVARQATEVIKRSTRPSDDALISTLAIHYNVHASKVIEWLLEIDLTAASQRMATEFA